MIANEAIPVSAPATGSAPAASAVGEPQNNDGGSLLDLLILLAERKRLILGVMCGCTMLAIVAALLLPKRYSATVTLLSPQQNSSMSTTVPGQLGGIAALAGGSIGIKNPNEIFVAMLRSSSVEDAVAWRFRLMEEYHTQYLSDARGVFESHVRVDGNAKDGLIHIWVEDGDPRRAAELANGYVEELRSFSRHMAVTEASQRRVFFEEQLELAKNNLAAAEEAMKQTQSATGLIQLDSQARALIESVASLRAQIAGKEVQIQSIRTYATEENAQLVQAKHELASLHAQLAKLGGLEDSSSGGLVVPKGKVPEASLEYVRKLREVKYSETVFEIVARQFESAKLDEARQGALIQVVDPAQAADRRSFPKRGLIVIGATVAGLFAGLFAALLNVTYLRMMAEPGTSGKVTLLKRALVIGSWSPWQSSQLSSRRSQ